MSGKPESTQPSAEATVQVKPSATTAKGTAGSSLLLRAPSPLTLFKPTPSTVRPKGSVKGIGDSSDSENDNELPPPKIDTNIYSDSDSEAEPENCSLK